MFQAKLFVVSALVLFISGCSAPPPPSGKGVSSSSPAPTAIACGDPTPLVKFGPGYAAPAGPLLFAEPPGDFRPGVPRKVPIQPRVALETPVTLQGWRCSDGHPLRFWYRQRGDPYWELQHGKTLETLGDVIATLEPAGVSEASEVVDASGEVHKRFAGPIGYGGYLLFTCPGKWKVSVVQQKQLLGSVVFLVTEA